MKNIFTLLMAIFCLAININAQAQCGSLAATITTLESRCAATGSISINATGGVAPQSYQYRLSAGPVTTAFTSSSTISGLPPGTYTVIVRDVTASCTITITNVVVAGTYVAPGIFYTSTAITCMNGSNGTISVTSQTGGRAPFAYQIIAPSPAQIGTTNSTGTFTGLIPGSYRIQLTDSCGAVQTRDQPVNNYTWQFNGNPTVTKPTCQNISVNISLTNINNIVSPNAVYNGFQYGISRFAGDTTWFASTPFAFNIGLYRTAKIVVKDNCGTNVLSYTWTDPKPSINNTVTVSNLACATYTATVTGQTNITAASTTYCLYNSANTVLVIACQSSPVFNNVPYGTYTVRTIDACYDTTILRTVTAAKPIPSVAANATFTNTCATFSAAITGQTNISNTANNYCLYANGSSTATSCNSTGTFTGLIYGVPYCIKLQNDPACYDTLIVRCFTTARPIQSVNANATLSGFTCGTFNVSIGGQTNLNNPTFCLFNSLNVQVGACNGTGNFNNIPNGTYCIKIQNDPACFDTLITRCFTVAPQIPSVNNTVTRNTRTCTTFTATIGGQTNVNNAIYRLYNGTNSTQIGVDQAGPTFTLLPYGSYCIRIVNDPACYDTTIVKCFTEAAPPVEDITLTPQQTCNLIGGTDIRVNHVAGIAPYISRIYSPAGALLNTSPPSGGGNYTFTSMPGLPVGAQYKVITTDACGSIDSATVTPNIYFINRTITKTAKCPSGTNPNGTGDVTVNVNGTENIGGSYAITIIKKDGVVVTITPNTTANNGRTANFLALVPATYIFQTDPSGCGVTANRFDTVIVPNYIYPTLVNSTGYQCDNGSQTVAGTVTGGAPPYQYQIFASVPSTPSINTAYQASPVFNFNNGTVYSLVRIRVLDNCGNAAINDVSFQPLAEPTIQQLGNCFFESVTLTADTITGATYNWYKRTYSPVDSVLVGTGKDFIIPFLQPVDTGLYICKVIFGGGCANRVAYKTVTGTCKAILGNKIWLDNGDGGGTASNGIQDGTETGVAGVSVNLYTNGIDGLPGTDDDILVGSTITDAFGNYLFDNLNPGNYHIKITPPANYSFTLQTNTTDDDNIAGISTTGSDVNGMGVSYTIALVAGENNSNIDAGLIFSIPPVPNSIGDKVWFDNGAGANAGNGVQDADEPGIAGVTVTLYKETTPGSNVYVVFMTTTTDASGNYLFNNLPANTNYKVGVSAPAGTILTTSTGTTPGNATTNSDIDPVTKLSAAINIPPAGAQITGIDAGLKNDPKGAIGDFVWNDLNHDGIQNAGEPGIPGVTMQLYNAGPDGLVGGGDDILVTTTTTDAFGNYVFPGLDPAKYFVVATPPAGYTVSPVDVTAANPGGDTKDNDFISGTSPYAGKLVSPAKILYPIAGGVTRDMTVDLGIYYSTPNLNSIGDKVWNDANGDGILNAGEAGMPNVTVRLLNGSGNPVMNPATGLPYIVTTDPNGIYKFVDLPDGNYIVEFANLPNGFVFSTQDASGSGAPGSATDGTNDSDAKPTTGRTGVINLDAASTNPASVNINNVDAGIMQGTPAGTASVGNRIWYDLDNDGIQDAGELGVANIKCELLDGNGNPVNNPATGTPYIIYTNGLGDYMFTNLPAGDYSVRFSKFPVGYTASPVDQGTNDGIDADATFAGASSLSTTATTAVFNLQIGQDKLNLAMGITPPAGSNSIGNKVWLDTNGNGIQDAAEAGVPGVMVSLFNNGVDGLPGTADDVFVGVTVTDLSGVYAFVGLADGNYNTVFSSLPAGYSFTGQNMAGSTSADGSDANVSSGRTGTIALDPTSINALSIQNVDTDAGLVTTKAAIGNYVWEDINGDGIQDANEPAISGVTVTLYTSDGVTVIASMVTDANGKYYFANITPGDYIVGFSTLPSGLSFTQQNSAGDNGNNTNSDANPGTGKTVVFTLSAGEIDLTIDAGLKPNNPASVGDFVWNDLNGDGIQNVNEPGVPGIIVTLYDASNNVAGTAITDGNGKYLISNVPAGNGYYIIFSNLPTTAEFTLQTSDVTPGDATSGSDANAATGRTAAFNLAAGQYLSTVDAGLKKILVLPIQLLSFTAQPQGNNVQLNWVVATETNVATYQVLYSTNGINFTAFASQPATGSRNYSQLHTAPQPGLNYYRLKVIDIDGSVTYSEIRKVNFGKADDKIALYPIPANTSVNITVSAGMVNKPATISIFSIDGRLMLQQTIPAFSQTETINVSKLASGKYIFSININNETINRQIEVIR
jgi:hypothetical protein